MFKRMFTGFHGWLYRLSNGRIGGGMREAKILVLTTTGRKSGKPRSFPLIYLEHGDAKAVMASNSGGASHPAWYFNLVANPDVSYQIRSDTTAATATTADAGTKAQLWPDFVSVYPTYEKYTEKTDRDFPVVLLTPRS